MDALEKNARYDREAREILIRVVRAGDGLVDVGCHRGGILHQMLEVGVDNEIHAFEPIPFLYAELVRTFGRFPHVHLHRLALADHNGPAHFHVVHTNSGYSGFRRRTYPRAGEVVEVIQVTATRLDDVLSHVSTRPLRFLKIDVEGAELAVLRGASATLTRERPFVVFEHGLGGADHYGTTPQAVYDHLAECGLRISTMRSWLTHGPAFDRPAFVQAFEEGREFYYLAHP